MTPKRNRVLLFIGAIGSVLLLSSSVKAENIIITQPTDFWFEYTQPTQFIAETYMVPDHQSDPQLWLYNEAGNLLYTNDDYRGLQSYISIEVQPGRYRLRAGTCCGQPDVWRRNSEWNIDYELAFNGDPASTTTTVPPTTTTTMPPTTTTVRPQTTTSTTTTTTTTEAPTTTTSTSTTTTSSLPPTTVPFVATTTSSPGTSVPVQPTVSSTIAATTTSSLASSTSSSTSTTTTTIPTIVLPPVVTPEEAIALATDPEVLKEVTPEQATEIFESLVVDDLTDQELVALISAVQDAPVAVRKSFEKSVNVFGGGVDTYVPIGSTVPVKTRRALIVMTLLSSLVALPNKRK